MLGGLGGVKQFRGQTPGEELLELRPRFCHAALLVMALLKALARPASVEADTPRALKPGPTKAGSRDPCILQLSPEADPTFPREFSLGLRV